MMTLLHNFEKVRGRLKKKLSQFLFLFFSKWNTFHLCIISHPYFFKVSHDLGISLNFPK